MRNVTRDETWTVPEWPDYFRLECLVKKLEYDPKPSSKLLKIFKKGDIRMTKYFYKYIKEVDKVLKNYLSC